MLNKNELEKIVINSPEELRPFEGKDLTGKYIVMSVTVKDIKLGSLEGCVIEGGGIVCAKLSRCNIYDTDHTYADEIYLSIFQRCKSITCGGLDEGYSVKASQFLNCGEILVYDAAVEDCIFDNFRIMFPTNVEMSNCIISNITCEEDWAISMEDGEFSNISFENIDLKNDSYLIEGYGSPWVGDSVFVNVRTSREDYELFHMEETKGKIFKKKVEYSFVDEDTCSGLELIPFFSGTNREEIND